ncbi:MAG: hypothetical protein KKE36_02385, partial [Actinobacteria bacterium]|nr:hypothetical protein [Actinomycetota bacterium]
MGAFTYSQGFTSESWIHRAACLILVVAILTLFGSQFLAFSSPGKVKLSGNHDGCIVFDVIVDSSDDTHVFWGTLKGSDPSIFDYYHSIKTSGQWATPVKLTSEIDAYATSTSMATYTCVRLDAEGVFHIAFLGKPVASSPGIIYMNNKNGVWDSLDITGVDTWPIDSIDMSVDSSGGAHIAWTGAGTASKELYYSSNISGSFSPRMEITSDDINQYQPLIGVAADGRVDIVYRENEMYVGEDLKSVRKEGAAFGAPSIICSSGSENHYHQMAIDNEGFAHVVWYSRSGYGHIGYSDNRAGAFSAPVWIDEPLLDPYCYSRIAIDSNGHSHITFTDLDYVYYVTDANGQMDEPRKVTIDPSPAPVAPIAIQGNGIIHVAWSQSNNQEGVNLLYHTWLTPDGFATPEIVWQETTADHWQNTLDIDSIGLAHFAWCDYVFTQDMSIDRGSTWYVESSRPTRNAGTFYFAEGTCRPGYDPYICVQNPGNEDAQVTITYMKGDGTSDS